MTMVNAESARQDALDRLRIVDTAPEDRFDRIVRIAQGLFDVPMVAVALIDHNRQWRKAAVGLPPEGTRDDAFCNYTIRQPGPLVVENATLDARFAHNPLVTGTPNIRFYAGQPLSTPSGHRVGSLCIIDDHPRHITSAQVDLLRDLANWVEKELAGDDELQRASQVQRSLLSPALPSVPGYEVAGRCFPAREVGGDFFDYYLVGDSLQLSIADVMGKGIGAALIAASARAVMRGATRFNDVAEAVNRAGYSLTADLMQTSTFVTLFSARLEPLTGLLTHIDAGHGLAWVVGAAGAPRHLKSDGLPLGALTHDTWHAQVTELLPGDTFVAVSDGFLDFFETPSLATQTLVEIVRRARTASEVVDLVAALCHAHPATDDVTVLVLRRTSGC